ncbi:MAG: thioredoxin domain-containing protein [Myxococcota bacterium]|nr:thioredoxin domain-containing protein [Myxococcota bacterium]
MNRRRSVALGGPAAMLLAVGVAAASDSFPWNRVIGFDTGALSASEKDRVATVAGRTPNYHGCRGTVAECIARDPVDRVAARLAGYIARRVKAGASDAEIAEGVADRRRSARPARTHQFELYDAMCLGSAGAPVTLVEFAEFQCPFCKAAAPFIHRLAAARSQQVRYCVKFFPVRSHDRAVQGCMAGLAAARQGKFFAMHDALFASAPDLSDEAIDRCARRAGLDMDRFRRDLAGEELRDEVEADKLEGQAAGVDRTPTFFVNGKKYFGRVDEAELGDRLDEELDLR